MFIHDDAGADGIVAEAVPALRQIAHHVGRLGPSFDAGQIAELQAAVDQVQNALNLKKRLGDATRS